MHDLDKNNNNNNNNNNNHNKDDNNFIDITTIYSNILLKHRRRVE